MAFSPPCSVVKRIVIHVVSCVILVTNRRLRTSIRISIQHNLGTRFSNHFSISSGWRRWRNNFRNWCRNRRYCLFLDRFNFSFRRLLSSRELRGGEYWFLSYSVRRDFFFHSRG